MTVPSWRQQGETGAESNLSECNSSLLLVALRGLAPILRDIANSERVFFPDNVQDIEFVAYKLDRLTAELNQRLVEQLGLTKPSQNPNHSSSSDASKPKEKRRKRLPDGSLGWPTE